MSADHLRKCPLDHYYAVADGTTDPFRCPACVEINALARQLAKVVMDRDRLQSQLASNANPPALADSPEYAREDSSGSATKADGEPLRQAMRMCGCGYYHTSNERCGPW